VKVNEHLEEHLIVIRAAGKGERKETDECQEENRLSDESESTWLTRSLPIGWESPVGQFGGLCVLGTECPPLFTKSVTVIPNSSVKNFITVEFELLTNKSTSVGSF
jgi:hypothetical protein